MDSKSFDDNGEVLLGSYKIIVDGLAPFVEKTLHDKLKDQWLNAVNSFRATRKPPHEPLVRRKSDNTIPWDVPGLLWAVRDFWPAFSKKIEEQCRSSGVNPKEIERVTEILSNYADLLRDLRNRGSHFPAASFTLKDRNRFLDLTEHFLRAIGKNKTADQIAEIFVEHTREIGEHRQIVRVKEIQAEFTSASSMRANPIVYDFLEQQAQQMKPMFGEIPHSMMRQKIAGKEIRIPVAVLAKDVRIELGNLQAEISQIDGVEQNEHIQKRHASMDATKGMPLIGVDRVTYTMSDMIITNGVCRVDSSLTKYLSIVATHDALEYELLSIAHQLQSDGKLDVKNIKMAARRRAEYLSLGTPGQRKFCGLSISTLIIFNTKDGGYKAMVRRRSPHTAMTPDLIHVLPACMFQAELGDVEQEWKIEHCIIKEYAEELFACKIDHSQDDCNYFLSNWPPARALQDALRVRQCELVPAGVFLNLFNFLPELCYVLFIHDYDWFETQKPHLKLNWEYLSRGEEMLQRHNTNIRDFDLDNVEQQFLKHTDQKAWSVEGLAAFWLGIEVAKKYLNIG